MASRSDNISYNGVRTLDRAKVAPRSCDFGKRYFQEFSVEMLIKTRE